MEYFTQEQLNEMNKQIAEHPVLSRLTWTEVPCNRSNTHSIYFGISYGGKVIMTIKTYHQGDGWYLLLESSDSPVKSFYSDELNLSKMFLGIQNMLQTSIIDAQIELADRIKNKETFYSFINS